MSQSRLMGSVLLVVLGLVAGCGEGSHNDANNATVGTTATTAKSTTASGSSSRPTPVRVASGTPLATGRWIAAGDAICARLNAHLKATHVRIPAELARVLPREAAYEHEEVKQLSKLVPPASKASDWKRFLNLSQQWANGSEEVAKDAKLGDAIAATPLAAKVSKLRGEALATAKGEGFKVCSSSS